MRLYEIQEQLAQIDAILENNTDAETQEILESAKQEVLAAAGEKIESILDFVADLKARAAFLKDEELGFINVKATPSGDFNIYGLPTSINCYSYGYHALRNLFSGLNPENNDEFSECIYVMKF